jgi:hypothetical protein
VFYTARSKRAHVFRLSLEPLEITGVWPISQDLYSYSSEVLERYGGILATERPEELLVSGGL